jgi:hypothetical protein
MSIARDVRNPVHHVSPLPPEDERRLEEDKDLARADFEARWKRENWTAIDVATWWSKWCRRTVLFRGTHVNGTNHDRLGRILMEVTGVKRPKTAEDIFDSSTE